MNGDIALQNAKGNKHRATSKYFRDFDGFADIEFSPKLSFKKEDKFFTIGSCFARNVENYLTQNHIPYLSKMENVDGDLFKSGGLARTGYQNVYTPGSVLEVSRLNFSTDPYHSIVEQSGLHYDLLTHGLKGMTLEVARGIRNNLLSAYRNLNKTDVLIITLGYTEAWYYRETQAWVNQSPAEPKLRGLVDGFELRVLDYNEVYQLLSEAFANFRQHNSKIKIILTVSPVPLGSTFTEEHVLVANQRSKSTLHTVAQKLWAELDYVDYFPSYEIVSLSDRQLAFEEDGVHVRQTIVSRVMERFFNSFFG